MPTVQEMRRVLLLCGVLVMSPITLISATDSFSDESRADHESTVDSEKSTERWWDDSTPQGMLTASWVFAGQPGGPSTQGPRIAYGPLGNGDEYYGWAEFWLAYREGGDQRVTSIGLALVPITLLYRRIGFGAMLVGGFEHRRKEDGAALAAVLGLGTDFVVRLSPRWDIATSAELDYRTTVDMEYQLRLGLRFHDKRISAW